ncbi:MAG: hypothetical protein EBU27_09720 [Opitutae bacterium]|nr:hypothetical protein [Opitutae bacterium]
MGGGSVFLRGGRVSFNPLVLDLPFFKERVGFPDKLGFGGLEGLGGVVGEDGRDGVQLGESEETSPWLQVQRALLD